MLLILLSFLLLILSVILLVIPTPSIIYAIDSIILSAADSVILSADFAIIYAADSVILSHGYFSSLSLKIEVSDRNTSMYVYLAVVNNKMWVTDWVFKDFACELVFFFLMKARRRR
ncbi:hypothetical protein GIB67_020930 [Kingdonia uniflora]|uniref:Uncharacterized protein n=1 Tax=Kingdonia uniflora TaxID=39325 RepID=A0A7J7M7I6_9MAGN|nr:hypothetical protein GIB67_020930 [Kingdonia uniflora]